MKGHLGFSTKIISTRKDNAGDAGGAPAEVENKGRRIKEEWRIRKSSGEAKGERPGKEMGTKVRLREY